MQAVDERWWQDPFAVRLVESGTSGEGVECGVKFLGWGNHVQMQTRKLYAIHRDYPETWRSSIEPQGAHLNWQYYGDCVYLFPGAMLRLASEFRFGDAFNSCDWLPPLLREWHTEDTSVGEVWNNNFPAISWSMVEAIAERDPAQLNCLTEVLLTGRRDGTRLYSTLSGHEDESAVLTLTKPMQGKSPGTYRSLPITTITTPKLTVTTLIAAAKSVNELEVPIKVFSVRQGKEVSVGGYWDEIVGWTELSVSHDNDDRRYLNGEVTFYRSYRLTRLTCLRLAVSFNTRNDGSWTKWQLFSPEDALCSAPPLISTVVGWEMKNRHGDLNRGSDQDDQIKACLASAPGELFEVMTRLVFGRVGGLMDKLTFDLLTDPPDDLLCLFDA